MELQLSEGDMSLGRTALRRPKREGIGVRVLYFDCFAGIAGDMTIGAMLDVIDGLEGTKEFSAAFPAAVAAALNVPDVDVRVSRGARGGLSGYRIEVATHEHHPHRHLRDVLDIIERSRFSPFVKERGAAAFRRLAEAEGSVHGVSPEEIHFHEVGAIDCLVDVLGAFMLLERLAPGRVICSPLNVGSGTVKCAHGLLPVPAPATSALLKGAPVFVAGEPMERVTPTGALLATMFADEFGTLPAGTLVVEGRGLGGRESDIPNALRVFCLECPSDAERSPLEHDAGVVLETNIDDMNPQFYAPAMERLFEAGALDVWLDSIMMKKGRPAVRLSCLCRPEDRETMASIILRHTTTLGMRCIAVDRLKARSESHPCETSLGTVRRKDAMLGSERIHSSLEYDDLLEVSRTAGIPLPELHRRMSVETGEYGE